MGQPEPSATHLVGTALGGGGGVTGDAAGDAAQPEAPLPAAERGEEPSPPTAAFDEGILDVLGQKVLLAWLRNRYQLLFPIALDLRRLDRPQTELLVHAMVAAAQADDAFEAQEQERIRGVLELMDPGGDQRALLDAALAQPKPLNELLREVRDVRAAALVYAASLMAVDRRKPVNRYYLRYLAARLQLSEEMVGSLEQRFRSAG
jgi:hypothetical protein